MTDHNENGNGGAEIKTALFSARLFGKDFQVRDFLVLAIFGLTSIMAYATYEHKTDTKDDRAQLINSLNRMVEAQTMSNCLSRFGANGVSDSVYERCRQIAKEAR